MIFLIKKFFNKFMMSLFVGLFSPLLGWGKSGLWEIVWVVFESFLLLTYVPGERGSFVLVLTYKLIFNYFGHKEGKPCALGSSFINLIFSFKISCSILTSQSKHTDKIWHSVYMSGKRRLRAFRKNIFGISSMENFYTFLSPNFSWIKKSIVLTLSWFCY